MEWIHTVQRADELITKAYSDKLNLLVALSKLSVKDEEYNMKKESIDKKIIEKDKKIEELKEIRNQLYELFK